jgi:hypothetical protein
VIDTHTPAALVGRDRELSVLSLGEEMEQPEPAREGDAGAVLDGHDA